MPLYDYQCEAGHRYEKRQPFGSPAEQPCERCKRPARRVLTVPPIVFKGSGWYKTDSTRSLRAGAGANGSSSNGDAESSSVPEGGAEAEPATPTTDKSSSGGKASGSKAKSAPAKTPAPAAKSD